MHHVMHNFLFKSIEQCVQNSINFILNFRDIKEILKKKRKSTKGTENNFKQIQLEKVSTFNFIIIASFNTVRSNKPDESFIFPHFRWNLSFAKTKILITLSKPGVSFIFFPPTQTFFHLSISLFLLHRESTLEYNRAFASLNSVGARDSNWIEASRELAGWQPLVRTIIRFPIGSYRK